MMAPVINRAQSIYGHDADDFRPERWLMADTEQLKAMDRTLFTVGGYRSSENALLLTQCLSV